jgi:hypothetical protein
MKGKRVCRMHGAYAGAPKGEAHGMYRHGRFTCEAVANRRDLAELIRRAQSGIASIS